MSAQELLFILKSAQMIDVSSNGTDIEVPFRPGQYPKFSLLRKTSGSTHVRAGQIAHHFLWITNHFWLMDNDDPLTGITQYRDDAFPEILTTLSVNKRRKQMTPFNLARGIIRLADIVFRSMDWTDQNYDWLFGAYNAGNTLTTLSPPDSSPFGSTGIAAKRQNPDNITAITSNVRTRFTGLGISPHLVFSLLREAMTRLWVYDRKGNAYELTHEHSALIIEDTGSGRNWNLRFEFTIDEERAKQIVWSTVTDRFLRLLQLLVTMNHYETFVSDFYIEQERFATLTLFAGNADNATNITAAGSELGTAGASNENVSTSASFAGSALADS